MIFRIYQHQDPSNNKTLTDAEFIPEADLMVTQTTQYLSTAIVLRSSNPIFENARATLLTDVSDLKSSMGKAEHNDLDDLDRLGQDSLGKEDKREIRQLEKWTENPPSNGVPPPPSLADNSSPPPAPPTPQGQEVPPPPQEIALAPGTPAPGTPAPGTSAPGTSAPGSPPDTSPEPELPPPPTE